MSIEREYPVFEPEDLQLIRSALGELGTAEAIELDEQIGRLAGFFVVDMTQGDGDGKK